MPRRMLVITLLAACLAAASACTGMHRAAKDVNVSGEDVVYLKDERTNLCFAVLYLQNKVGTSVSEMAMTPVPCEALGGVPTR